jgi:hypothetical protein
MEVVVGEGGGGGSPTGTFGCVKLGRGGWFLNRCFLESPIGINPLPAIVSMSEGL